jgi:putative intracellular protease/amidase
MKRVLVILTNVAHYPGTTNLTGLWLGEATEFVKVMQDNGILVDYASPNGGFVPLDPRSMKYATQNILDVYNTDDFKQRALSNSLPLDKVNPNDYGAIYFTGGHGVVWDFPDNRVLQSITMQIYNNNGFVTSVCHGIVGLLNLKDYEGNYLIHNKSITGFTRAEEILAGKNKIVPFFNQSVAEQHGAKFKKKRAYKEYAIQDGRIITGQNPFSAQAVARLLVNSIS